MASIRTGSGTARGQECWKTLKLRRNEGAPRLIYRSRIGRRAGQRRAPIPRRSAGGGRELLFSSFFAVSARWTVIFLKSLQGCAPPLAPHMSRGSRATQAKPEGASHPDPSTREETSGDVSLLRPKLAGAGREDSRRRNVRSAKEICMAAKRLSGAGPARGIEVLAVRCGQARGKNSIGPAARRDSQPGPKRAEYVGD